MLKKKMDITTKETENLEVNSTFLSNLVKDNKLERVGIGIYKLPEYPIANFYILSKSSKNMCYFLMEVLLDEFR